MRDLAASIEAAGRQTAEGAVKIEEDLARYRAIIELVQPDTIVECGTFTGRSAAWFAGVSNARVVTIDYDEPPRVLPEVAAMRNVTCLRGSSIDPAVIAQVRDWVSIAACTMVVLDSDHSAAHVEAELDAYAKWVSVGSYIVVEDTICRWLTGPIVAPYVGTPYDAVDRWLPEHENFVNDIELEDLYPATQNCGGWLRRIS